MQHQILSLRSYYNDKKEEHDITDNWHFKRKWRFDSIDDVLLNCDKLIAQVPPEERWNLFYTVAHCSENKREFVSQNIIMFDIDKLDATRKQDYIPIVWAALKLRGSGVIDSGNGLHFIIKLKSPITEKNFFEQNRRHYNAIVKKIDLALKQANLPGNADPAVFDARRIMRLPLTENRKDGKPARAARVLVSETEIQDFVLACVSGLPEVTADDHIDPTIQRKIPTDTKAVLAGCNFLKHLKDHPNEISEAEWYAGLSILGRLDRKIAHEYSSGHRSYSIGETETKIDQALEASGPRTCKGINNLWGQCPKCPYFEKITSPVMLQGAEFIRTEQTGFHSLGENGKVGKPQYDDLRKFFRKQHPFVTLGGSGICMAYKDGYWQQIIDKKLEEFADHNFKPIADNKMAAEFKGLICRSSVRDAEWFSSTTIKKINFSNGVLDLKENTLSSHSVDYGFMYKLNYAYDPEARAPMFEKFLFDVMDGREDLVRLLLEYMGYCFSGDKCWAQKALILLGNGANGKSTFMEILTALAGDTNYSSLTMHDLENPVFRHGLVGKLFNLSEETPHNAMHDTSIFKTLVSGGETTVKILYKQPYWIKNRTKLMFACNELPNSKDTTRGFLRRLLIVPFDREFRGSERDPHILEKMLPELPGIFNLVLKSYRELAERREFTQAAGAHEKLSDYNLEIDTIKRWASECILENPTSTRALPTQLLYNAYKTYCDDEGERPDTKTTFCKKLGNAIPNYKDKKKKVKVQGRVLQALVGLDLLTDNQTH